VPAKGLAKALKMKRLPGQSFGENEKLFFVAPYIDFFYLCRAFLNPNVNGYEKQDASF
jgi:hypothetical protein